MGCRVQVNSFHHRMSSSKQSSSSLAASCGLANLALHHGRHRQFEWFLGGALLPARHLWHLSSKSLPDLSQSITYRARVHFRLLHSSERTDFILSSDCSGCVGIWAMHLDKDPHEDMRRKFGLFAIYWHFLDVVWIFIFTIVYLMGVL